VLDDETVAKVHKKHIRRITELRPDDYFLKNGRSFRTKGYYVGLNFGLGFGEDGVLGGSNLKVGHYLKPKLVVGVGGGIESFSSVLNISSVTTVPVYGFVRGFPIQRTISPYYGLELGWGIGSASNSTYSFSGSIISSGSFFGNEGLFSYQGSYRIKPVLGIRIASRRSSTFIIESGLILQRAYVDFSGYDRTLMTNVEYQGHVLLTRVTIDFGWMF